MLLHKRTETKAVIEGNGLSYCARNKHIITVRACVQYKSDAGKYSVAVVAWKRAAGGEEVGVNR